MQSRARDSQTHLTWPDTRCLRCLKGLTVLQELWAVSAWLRVGLYCSPPASDCRQDRHQHWDRTGTTSCLHPANNLQSCKLPAVLLGIRVTIEEACHCLATVLPLSCHTADIQLALRLLPVPAHCAGHSDCHLPPSRRKYFMFYGNFNCHRTPYNLPGCSYPSTNLTDVGPPATLYSTTLGFWLKRNK